jgi:hypothetical protein
MKEITTMSARALPLLCVTTACLLGSRALADGEPKKEETKKPSPYAGTYSGTFTFVTLNGADQEGEMTLTIDEGGNVKGEATNKTIGGVTKVKGTILKENKAVLVLESDNQKANAFGTISKTEAGGITGTLTQRVGTNVVGGIEFEMNPKKKGGVDFDANKKK